MVSLLIAVLNILILLGNLGVLWIMVKLYTEILKIEHVKKIGK